MNSTSSLCRRRLLLAVGATLIGCSSGSADSTDSVGAPTPAAIKVKLPTALGGGMATTQLASAVETSPRHAYGVPWPWPVADASAKQLAGRELLPAAYPTRVDISTGVPPIGDQGHTSSCQSWATGYVAMGWWANHVGLANAGFSAMYLYSQLVTGSCDHGAWAEDALNIIKTQGIDTISDYEPMHDQLDCGTQPSAAQRNNAGHFKVSSYTKYNLAGGAANAIKAALAGGYPALLAITIYPEFDAANPMGYFVGPPVTGDKARGGHEITAFAYDENGVWIVNQWGTAWGNSGWAQLSWDFINGTFNGNANVGDVAAITGVNVGCTDRSAQCNFWATASQCQANPDYMLTNCCASCADPGLADLSYTYHPVSATSSCLDLKGDVLADSTSIDEWACNATPAQSFKLLNATGGFIYMYHPQSGKCLDIQLGGVENGTPLQLYDCNGSAAQTFQVGNNADGSFTFQNPHSGRCLDVDHASAANGTKIQLWDCNGSAAQEWNYVAN